MWSPDAYASGRSRRLRIVVSSEPPPANRDQPRMIRLDLRQQGVRRHTLLPDKKTSQRIRLRVPAGSTLKKISCATASRLRSMLIVLPIGDFFTAPDDSNRTRAIRNRIFFNCRNTEKSFDATTGLRVNEFSAKKGSSVQISISEATIDNYKEMLIRRGDSIRTLSRYSRNNSVEIRPLNILDETKDLVVDEKDVAFLASEVASELRIIPETLFISKDVEIFPAGLPVVENRVCGRVLRTKKFLKRVLQSTPEQPVSSAIKGADDALLIGPLEQFNYSHWMLEGLPKIALYRQITGSLPSSVIIAGRILKFHSESIAELDEKINIKSLKTIPVKLGQLAYTTSLARSVSEINPFVFDFYRQHFPATAQSPPRRIYISRSNAGHRKMRNEDQFFATLEGYGFQIVHLENLSVREQIKTFSEAEIIVGIHGAGFANLVFAHKAKLFVEIFSSGFRDSSVYAHICRHKAISYLACSGTPSHDVVIKGPKDPEGWPGHKSFTIDLDRFFSKFEAVLSRVLRTPA